MSSAILYLAIIAIWAGVLVPRWLRPRVMRPAEARPQEDVATPGEPEVAGAARATRPAQRGEREPDHEREQQAAWTAEAKRRAGILRVRRRMLGTLAVLTAGAVGITAAGIADWWVVIPPAVMLGGFLLLLREAARADADRVRGEQVRGEQVERRGGAERVAAGQRARPAGDHVGRTAPVVAEQAAPEPEPRPEETWSAQIIDISGRVGDQLYDQYADAAVRAVGD